MAGGVGWSPDSKQVVTGGLDGTIRVWSASGVPERTMVLLSDDRFVTFSAAGELLYGDPEVIEKEIIYLLEKEDGRTEVLSPSSFRQDVQGARAAQR
jgi:WD40 repeat protein